MVKFLAEARVLALDSLVVILTGEISNKHNQKTHDYVWLKNPGILEVVSFFPWRRSKCSCEVNCLFNIFDWNFKEFNLMIFLTLYTSTVVNNIGKKGGSSFSMLFSIFIIDSCTVKVLSLTKAAIDRPTANDTTPLHVASLCSWHVWCILASGVLKGC